MIRRPRVIRRAGERTSVATALRALQPLIPRPWDVDLFVARLAAARCRDIVLVPWSFPDGRITGYCIPAPTVDYIYFSAAAPPTRRAAIITHELAHLVLGHHPQRDVGTLRDLMGLSVEETTVLRFLARHGYEADQEAQAETLATLLVAARMSQNRRVGRDDDGPTELGRLTASLR